MASELTPLCVLIVEDQALIAMELQLLVEDAGHDVRGWATDLKEAYSIVDQTHVDLALVDFHLADGPSGGQLAAELHHRGISVVFMTANANRIPQDFVGAIGVMSKPYTAASVAGALSYLHIGVRKPPPRFSVPPGLRLSPEFAGLWAAH